MPVKIRLMRIGAKKRPFYRVVAVDEQRKRTGGYLELLGTYNPLTQPKEIILKQDRIDDWVKKGAQYSDGFLRIIGKAPQRPPRKPKKPARNALARNASRNDASGSQSDAGGEKKVEEAKAPSPTPVAEPGEETKGQGDKGTRIEAENTESSEDSSSVTQSDTNESTGDTDSTVPTESTDDTEAAVVETPEVSAKEGEAAEK